jgi:hypothetical protein
MDRWQPLTLAAFFIVLAGCATPAQPLEAVRPTHEVQSVAEPIDFRVGLGLHTCTPTLCTWLGGYNPHYQFDSGNYSGFELNVTIASEFPPSATGPHAVIFTVHCQPAGRGGCPGWKNVVVEGVPPLRIVGGDVHVRPKDVLTLDVEAKRQSTDVMQGSGAEYDVQGTMRVLRDAPSPNATSP